MHPSMALWPLMALTASSRSSNALAPTASRCTSQASCPTRIFAAHACYRMRRLQYPSWLCATTGHHGPPRATTGHHGPPRATTGHHGPSWLCATTGHPKTRVTNLRPETTGPCLGPETSGPNLGPENTGDELPSSFLPSRTLIHLDFSKNAVVSVNNAAQSLGYLKETHVGVSSERSHSPAYVQVRVALTQKNPKP
jgi:hypothetical protein